MLFGLLEIENVKYLLYAILIFVLLSIVSNIPWEPWKSHYFLNKFGLSSFYLANHFLGALLLAVIEYKQLPQNIAVHVCLGYQKESRNN